MATYKSLKVLFHETKTSAESAVSAKLERRLANPATGKYPYFVGDNALFVVLSRDVYQLSEAVWKAENTIQRLWDRLPGAARAHYYYTLLVDEIQSTNAIENVQSNRHEVAEALTAIVQERLSEPPQALSGNGQHF